MAEFLDIQREAYSNWQKRGCPVGSPLTDWLQAETVLKSEPSHARGGSRVRKDAIPTQKGSKKAVQR